MKVFKSTIKASTTNRVSLKQKQQTGTQKRYETKTTKPAKPAFRTSSVNKIFDSVRSTKNFKQISTKTPAFHNTNFYRQISLFKPGTSTHHAIRLLHSTISLLEEKRSRTQSASDTEKREQYMKIFWTMRLVEKDHDIMRRYRTPSIWFPLSDDVSDQLNHCLCSFSSGNSTIGTS
jgi:hypothetical protein